MIFSKLQGAYWPNVELVAQRAVQIVDADYRGEDASPCLATGTKVRGASPTKQRGSNQKSPSKGVSSPTRPTGKRHQDETPVRPFNPDDSQKFLETGGKQSVVDHKGEHTICGSHLRSVDDPVSFPTFKANERGSLLCKYLTRPVWNKLANAKDSLGVSFKQCIFSGCKNTDSGIGVYAASPNSYEAFAYLFTPIIEDYHKVGINDGHVSNMNHEQLRCPPFPPEDAAMIRSTRIRVGRNLAAFPLGPGISREQRREVERLVTSALSKFTGDLKGTYYSLESMTPAQQQQLIDDHFLFKEGDRFLEACGLNRDLPEGRGIFHNDEKTFLTWVNEEDQLRIISM